MRVAENDHFIGKFPIVQDIYKKLMKEVLALGKVHVSAVKQGIMVVSRSTFLAIKPKKAWLDIEFLLDEEVNEYPIHKVFRANKSRVAHFVRLEHPREVNKRLLGWLKRAYTVTSSGC